MSPDPDDTGLKTPACLGTATSPRARRGRYHSSCWSTTAYARMTPLKEYHCLKSQHISAMKESIPQPRIVPRSSNPLPLRLRLLPLARLERPGRLSTSQLPSDECRLHHHQQEDKERPPPPPRRARVSLSRPQSLPWTRGKGIGGLGTQLIRMLLCADGAQQSLGVIRPWGRKWQHGIMPSPSSKRRSAQRPGKRERQPAEPPAPRPTGPLVALPLTQLEPAASEAPLDCLPPD